MFYKKESKRDGVLYITPAEADFFPPKKFWPKNWVLRKLPDDNTEVPTKEDRIAALENELQHLLKRNERRKALGLPELDASGILWDMELLQGVEHGTLTRNVFVKRRRAKQTYEERKEKIREASKRRYHERIANMTPEEDKAMRIQWKEWHRQKMASMTPEERRAWQDHRNEQQRERRKRMTPEQREKYLQYYVRKMHEYRERETPEQKQERYKRREGYRKKYFQEHKKKIAEQRRIRYHTDPEFRKRRNELRHNYYVAHKEEILRKQKEKREEIRQRRENARHRT